MLVKAAEKPPHLDVLRTPSTNRNSCYSSQKITNDFPGTVLTSEKDGKQCKVYNCRKEKQWFRLISNYVPQPDEHRNCRPLID